MKIEDKAYFEMQPNLQGMKKVRDEIYALAQTHLRLSEKSTDSQKQNYEYRIAAGLSSFVSRAPYAAEIGMEFKGSAYWNKKAIQLAKEGAALGVIADKLIAEALSIYNSHSKPVEDKRYFAISSAETEKKIRDLTAAWRKLINVADNLHGMANPSPEIMKRQDQVDADMERIGNQIAELKKSIGVQENVSVRLAKPVEDKAYFDRRIYHSTGTFHTLLDKETRVPIDGTSKWVTVDPAQYITPRRVRISGIKGEIEIAAQLSGDEIKGIFAKTVKATAARQGSKAKFAYVSPKYEREDSWLAKITDKAERAYTTISQLRERLSSLQNMLQRTPPGTARTELEAYYKTQIQAMSNAKKEYEQSIKHSRTGTKAKFASDTNYAHKNTIKIKGKSDKIYALIYAEEGYGDNLTGFWNGHVQNNSNPKVNDMVTIGQFKSKEAAKAAAIKALKQEEQGTNFSKAKFANRGAFAEASSSPVLGSLLEKKVMPEGGWRAVETDGGALVIAFEDGDIAGNFARRAAENGYSATAPMAMAGRFWNVKVQNENKQ